MKKRMISPLLLLFLFATMVGCANDESVTAPVADPELCDNGIDDDGDGLIDCDDPDCVNDPICPCTSVVGWILNPDNGHLYRLTSRPLSIDDARAEADALCGYLVSIADQNENEFVRDNFSGPAQALTYCWIGLSDEVTEGEWLWDSGELYIPSNAQWIGGDLTEA